MQGKTVGLLLEPHATHAAEGQSQHITRKEQPLLDSGCDLDVLHLAVAPPFEPVAAHTFEPVAAHIGLVSQ